MKFSSTRAYGNPDLTLFKSFQVGWRLLRFWFAGNVACKLFAFLRAFGFYLSSMVLIVVSLDRYIAIIYPLRANSEFARRGHFMLLAAWAVSALCSLPQVRRLIFGARTVSRFRGLCFCARGETNGKIIGFPKNALDKTSFFTFFFSIFQIL